jgi:hypothetical protein
VTSRAASAVTSTVSPGRIHVARRLLDPLIIVAITVFTGLLSTSQRWSGLDTPDSSFYASLGLFGDEITDRSVEQSYYWTRLGTIAPIRALTGLLGTWRGFDAYRLILLLIIVAAAYVTLRRFTSRPSAAVITVLISLSTVVLSYLSNSYLTGSVLAGTAALIALAMSDTQRAAVVAGVTLGWLAMVNPAGALLAGVIWLTIRIHARTRPLQVLIAAGAAIVTFAVFLVIGRFIFPRMNWFESFLATREITMSNFASTSLVWLGDISLLVPAAVLVVVVVHWARNRGSRPAQLAFMISASSITFMLVFSPLMGGIALEAPMYQAMLWPPALMALGLAAASAIGDKPWGLDAKSWSCWATAAVAVVLVILAGHWPGSMSFAVGCLLAIALTALAITALGSSRLIVILAGLALFLAGAQLLQNSRGPLGLYYLSPYNWAFNANPISEKIHTAVNTQEWLLANTTRNDQILSWVGADWVGGDRELFVVAGMQLWGENRVTLEPTMSAADLERLNTIRPTTIAMYAPTMQAITNFWSSIPSGSRATAPNCYDFAWPNAGSPQGHACLTTLTWSE